MNPAARYYIRDVNGERGPFVFGQLQAMWNSGAITANTTYRLDGMSDWAPLAELFAVGESAPPQAAKGGGCFNALGVGLILFSVWLFLTAATVFNQIFAGIIFLAGLICVFGSSLVAKSSSAPDVAQAPSPAVPPASPGKKWLIITLLIVGAVSWAIVLLS